MVLSFGTVADGLLLSEAGMRLPVKMRTTHSSYKRYFEEIRPLEVHLERTYFLKVALLDFGIGPSCHLRAAIFSGAFNRDFLAQ